MTYHDSIVAAPAALIQNPWLPTPSIIADNLVALRFTHWDFSGAVKTGTFVIHTLLVTDLQHCVRLAWKIGFPIHQAVSPGKFGWCDKASCEANNSSAHNMRYINRTTRLSKHAGAAFDLNPMQNPCVEFDDNGNVVEIIPKAGAYNPASPGTLYRAHPIVQLMLNLGWTWGGDWTNPWDTQHFQKVLPELAHLYE